MYLIEFLINNYIIHTAVNSSGPNSLVMTVVLLSAPFCSWINLAPSIVQTDLT